MENEENKVLHEVVIDKTEDSDSDNLSVGKIIRIILVIIGAVISIMIALAE
jgi:hypothetical protein